MDHQKLSKLNINDFVKDRPTARLQSLRLPRDLSLGGTKSKKKQLYKPNLNVVRNKFKVTSTEKKPEKLKPKKIKEANKRVLFQTTGIFSEGINNVPVVDKPAKPKHTQRTAPIIVPKARKENKTPSIRKEATVVNEIKHFEDSDNDTVDTDVEPAFRPVHFRFDNEVTDDSKSEPDYEQDNYLPPEYNKNQSDSTGKLCLWQLPVGLPFKNGSHPSKTNSDCSLIDLPEGKIGSIFIRKSGKIDVHIGNIKCQLDSIQAGSFKEELAVLDVESRMSVLLGEIKRRFVLKPDLRTVLPM